MNKKGVFPLSVFQEWLQARGATLSTTYQYTTKVRATLNALGCTPENEPDMMLRIQNREAVLDYVNALAPSTRSLAVSAWSAYREFLKTYGVDVPSLRSETRASVLHPADAAPGAALRWPLPNDVVSALWTILRYFDMRKSGLSPQVLHAMRWYDVTWEPQRVRSAIGAIGCTMVDFDKHAHAYLQTHMSPWRVLWAFAHGEALPALERPIVPSALQGFDPVDLSVLAAVVQAGRHGRVPLMRDDPRARAAQVFAPPPGPPVPDVEPVEGPPPSAVYDTWED